MARRRVLVTGGAGFVGGYVVRELLDHGYEVVVLDPFDFRPETRFVIGEDIGQVKIERGSVDDWPTLLDVVKRHEPTDIVHLAAIMDVPLLDRSPMLAYKVNVGGTMNILEVARQENLGRVVIFSTIAVIPVKQYEPIDAMHPTVLSNAGPLGAYSAAKLAGEAFGYAYNQSFGVDFRCIRPSALYGFGMSWFAPNYMKNIVEPALDGIPVRLASGGPVPRDYTHAADVASLVRAVLEGPADADRVFFAATGKPLCTGGDVARIVRDLVPESDVVVADEWTDSDRDELAFRGEISIENARSQLGWEPQFADLEDGVRDYIERYRAFVAAGGSPARPVVPGMAGAPGSGNG